MPVKPDRGGLLILQLDFVRWEDLLRQAMSAGTALPSPVGFV